MAALLGTRMARVQESVFEGWLNAIEIHRVLAEVAALIEPAADAVRAYPLALREPARRQPLGCQPVAEEPAAFWIV